MSALLNNSTIRACIQPISVEQYRRMGEAGIIDTGTELIRGVILRKMIKSPQHTLTVKRLVETLVLQLSERVELRKEEPLTLDNSEPEPDVALVIRDSYDPLHCHPSTAVLVIEVAISSEALDRAKATIYAAAKIPEYWLVLPGKKCVERFTVPQGEGYLHVESIDFTGSIEFVVDRVPVVVDLGRLID